MEVTPTQTGVQFVRATDRTLVRRGDMIGVRVASGQLSFRSAASSCFEVSSSHTVQADMTCSHGENQFRAHIMQVN